MTNIHPDDEDRIVDPYPPDNRVIMVNILAIPRIWRRIKEWWSRKENREA